MADDPHTLWASEIAGQGGRLQASPRTEPTRGILDAVGIDDVIFYLRGGLAAGLVGRFGELIADSSLQLLKRLASRRRAVTEDPPAPQPGPTAQTDGYDDDLAQESTRLTNRIRGLLTHIHPALERMIGPKLDGKAALMLLSRHGGPAGLRTAGRRKLTATAVANAPRAGAALVEDIMTALDEQTVVVPGTTAAETVLPGLADALSDVLRRRSELATQVEEILDAHPLAGVLISMPGIGIRTAARILLEVGDGSFFATPGHLAAYAGIAPVTHRSGSSIRGEQPARGGNKQLKRAFFLSAFASLKDPASRAPTRPRLTKAIGTPPSTTDRPTAQP